MEIYDVIVLGGGPGGYLAAARAAGAGLKTLLLEKDKLGGVCLNEGCIPSKTLLNSAKLYNYAKGGGRAYGVSDENAAIDQAAVIARKDAVVDMLVKGVAMKVKGSGAVTVNKAGFITGSCADGFLVTADGETYACTNLIIATGAGAAVPPIKGVREGLDSGLCITSKEALNLNPPPRAMVVIGGGVIGLELASYYNSIGCEVVVIEALGKIGGSLDAEISLQFMKAYEKRGVVFHLNANVTEVGAGSVCFEKGGTAHEVACDKVLLSVGRTPNISGIGLENVGVEAEKEIRVDGAMRTNVAGIYAIGDCTGRQMLAHCAYRGAEVAVSNILGTEDSMEESCIPSVIYSHPEVACAGLTEEEANAKGISCRVVRIPASYSGRAMAESNDGAGMCKLVIATENETLIGVQLMAPYASEIILACVVMIEEKLPIKRIQKYIFPHPTVGELIREGLFH